MRPRDYLDYSVVLDRAIGAFAIGDRLCVAQVWRGKLRLCVYAGCGADGELKWVSPADVTIWRPSVGDRFQYLPNEGGTITIVELETNGPGWHDARFLDGREYFVHDQELGDIDA